MKTRNRGWLPLAALCALLPTAALAQAPNCVPSCAVDDARFLAITDGSGLDTLNDQRLDLQLRSPGSRFVLGFFDGETSGSEGNRVGLWDVNTGPDPGGPGNDPYAAQLTFTLLADPAGDGSGTTVVRTFDGEAMLDNDWSDFTVSNHPAARSENGDYVYILRAELGGTLGPAVRSSFKVRSAGDVFIEVFGQPFAFAAALPGIEEIGIVYPDCQGVPPTSCLGTLDNTTYSGDFPFFLTVGEPRQELVVWDGDLDRGNFDGSFSDTDDFNTAPGFAGLPPWACIDPGQPCTADGGANPRLPGVEFEAVATGLGPSTGNPPDDSDASAGGGLAAFFVRTGAVSYEVWGPDGQLLATNDNPSGNREWERFRVATVDDGAADEVVDELPAGLYEVRVKGLDLENLNVFRFDAAVGAEPVCPDGDFGRGRPSGLTFIYTGDPCGSAAASNNRQGGAPGTTGDYRCVGPLDGEEPVRLVVVKKPERVEVSPDTAAVGERLTMLSTSDNGKLSAHLELQLQAADGTPLQDVTIHTSCSQPLAPRDQFGSLRVFRMHYLF